MSHKSFSRWGRRATSVVLVLVAAASVAQAQIYQQSFETDAGYTLTTAFDDGFFDYFGRYTVPDVDNGGRDDFANGWDGVYGIHSQDNDGAGGSATATVGISGIDVSGYNNLSATIALGALASEAAGFDNYEAEDNDGIVILASIDGGMATEIGRFSPPASGLNSMTAAGDLLMDMDGDGVGTGAALSVDLADFTFAIGETGSSLDLSIELTSTGSFEPLALDNVRVNGEQVPEPSSSVLGLMFVAGLFAVRRRR